MMLLSELIEDLTDFLNHNGDMICLICTNWSDSTGPQQLTPLRSTLTMEASKTYEDGTKYMMPCAVLVDTEVMFDGTEADE